MEIRIMDRDRLEMISNFPFPSETAVISINDAGSPAVKMKKLPQYLLRLTFNDIDPDEIIIEGDVADQIRKYGLFTEIHASKIAEFYHSYRSFVKLLICQCEFGQSRSAAVAAAIREYASGTGIDIFADRRYYPNKHVFHMTLQALRNMKK